MSADRLRVGENTTATKATLEDVPIQDFYFNDLTEKGRATIEVFKQDPHSAVEFSTWRLSSGDKYVPMIGCKVGDYELNLDARGGYGKLVHANFLRDNGLLDE